MASRWITLGMVLALAANAAGQPPPTIPESDPKGTTFIAPPQPSSIQPFVVPPSAPKGGPALPTAPPAPAITMLVLVPHDAPPNQPIPYTIQVTNNSTADAGKVKVRMPLPEGTQFESSEPPPLEGTAGKELVWDIRSLPKGETKKIELKLKAVGNLSEIQAKAYVSYEFGQAVRTRLSAPKLKVTTELPKDATTADETIPVRVLVTNHGRVPVTNVKLTETISEGSEFHRDTDGDKTASPQARTWDLGTIPAGMGKTVEFRLTSKAARDLRVISNVDAGGVVQDSHENKVKVQDAKLKIELRGEKVGDDAASFKAVVKNDGAMALTNIRVTGSVPQDCKVTSRTNGGQIFRDSVVWVLPKLAAGDSFLLKWEMRSTAAGRKTVHAEAATDRGLRDAMDVQTTFAGAAALSWEQRFESPTVVLDKTGMFTVKVTNAGSELAKSAKLVVTLPPEVSFVQATPAHQRDGQKLVFEARDVRVGGTEVYSITFRGERSGPAYFKATLDAESLNGKPMNAEKYVQIMSGR